MPAAFHLEDWQAWSAAQPSVAIRRQHDLSSNVSASPLPPMLRRRLDEVGRATCGILSLLDSESACPLIHASRHGDASHTLQMLESITQGEPISPTRFSMSVHNAVLGVHSIANRHHLPLQALGACGNEFDALLCEANGYLVEGYPAVVIVFSEGPLPAPYQGYAEDPGLPSAVGMRLSFGPGTKLESQPVSSPSRPTPADVIAWLNADTPFLDGLLRWRLEAG
ncbi:beta-ketoacyl synthase chain length factor [Halomonas sp. HL-93]|uniref:beta-ketoacyl synthase chain length factor n=1 Tax=Halomonas sp. HL-93 TaxID=1666906 RepID=UPI0006DAF4CB|nr:beta-ketoacyl synthase chain length factor [Halomonas sp. HL-93]KPQ22661.1 MAG: Beta-ketoacyl synthase, N-terminal domain [Halomonas sp. HL-93]SBR45418.1 Beta-ketoacyl synthase, N-terminal domain [Halomonas sp. HL-93]